MLVDSDTVREVSAIALTLQFWGSVPGPGAGWALTTGMTIAAEPKASRPPANMPYRPRRTVFSDIFIESLL